MRLVVRKLQPDSPATPSLCSANVYSSPSARLWAAAGAWDCKCSYSAISAALASVYVSIRYAACSRRRTVTCSSFLGANTVIHSVLPAFSVSNLGTDLGDEIFSELLEDTIGDVLGTNLHVMRKPAHCTPTVVRLQR